VRVGFCGWSPDTPALLVLDLIQESAERVRSVELHCGGQGDEGWNLWLLMLQARQLRMEWDGDEGRGHWLGVPARCLTPLQSKGESALTGLRRSLESMDELGSLVFIVPEACQHFRQLRLEFLVDSATKIPVQAPRLNLLRVVDRCTHSLPWNAVEGRGALYPAEQNLRVLCVQRILRLQGLRPVLYGQGPISVLRLPNGAEVQLELPDDKCTGSFLAEVDCCSGQGLHGVWKNVAHLDMPRYGACGIFKCAGQVTGYIEERPWDEWSSVLSQCLDVLWLRSEDWGAWLAFLQNVHPTLHSSHPLRKVQTAKWHSESQVMSLQVTCKNYSERAKAWAWAKALERFQAKALGLRGYPHVEVQPNSRCWEG